MLLSRDVKYRGFEGFRRRPRVDLRGNRGCGDEVILRHDLGLIDLAILNIDEKNTEETIQKILLLHEYDDQVLFGKNINDEIPLHYMIKKYKVRNLKAELRNSYFKVIQLMCHLSPGIVQVKTLGRLP